MSLRPSETTIKLREWLKKLPGEAFDKTTYADYRKATHDNKTSPAVFNNEKRRETRDRGFAVKTRAKSKGAAPAAAAGSPLPAPAGLRTVRVLATLPLEPYQGVDAKTLKAFAADMLKRIHGRPDAVELHLLADPVALEIREPA